MNRIEVLPFLYNSHKQLHLFLQCAIIIKIKQEAI